MDIGAIAVEQLRVALGDRAESIDVAVFQAVSDGAAAARTALGSDQVYAYYLSLQSEQIQAGEEKAADEERAIRRRHSRFLDFDEQPAARVNTRQFLKG